jgi:hypothetical protein
MRWGIPLSAFLTVCVVATGAQSQSTMPTARFDDVGGAAPPASTPPASTPPAAPASPPSRASSAPASPPKGGAAPSSVPVSAEDPPSTYARADVVDPFPPKSAAPESRLLDPYPGYRAPIPHLDELLIVNPYSKMLARVPAQRYFEPPTGQVRTGLLEISAPPGFRGAVYLNGMAVPTLPARTTVLAGEHGLTVAPASGSPFTVWVHVGPGQHQQFRFSLTGAAVAAAPTTP